MSDDYNVEYDAPGILDGLDDEPSYEEEAPRVQEHFRGFHEKVTDSIQIRAYRSGPADGTGRKGGLVLEIPSPSEEVVRAIRKAYRGTYDKLKYHVLVYRGLEILDPLDVATELDVEPQMNAPVLPTTLSHLQAWFDAEYQTKRRELDRMEAQRMRIEKECMEAVRLARERADAEITAYRASARMERDALDADLMAIRERRAKMLEQETAMQEQISQRELQFSEMALGQQQNLLEESRRYHEMRPHLHKPETQEGGGVIDKIVQAAESPAIKSLAEQAFAAFALMMQKK